MGEKRTGIAGLVGMWKTLRDGVEARGVGIGNQGRWDGEERTRVFQGIVENSFGKELPRKWRAARRKGVFKAIVEKRWEPGWGILRIPGGRPIRVSPVFPHERQSRHFHKAGCEHGIGDPWSA